MGEIYSTEGEVKLTRGHATWRAVLFKANTGGLSLLVRQYTDRKHGTKSWIQAGFESKLQSVLEKAIEEKLQTNYHPDMTAAAQRYAGLTLDHITLGMPPFKWMWENHEPNDLSRFKQSLITNEARHGTSISVGVMQFFQALTPKPIIGTFSEYSREETFAFQPEKPFETPSETPLEPTIPDSPTWGTWA